DTDPRTPPDEPPGDSHLDNGKQLTGMQAQSIVDHEIIAVLTEQGLVDRAEIANLHEALVASRRIGAAMGILMATDDVDEAGAFDLLRSACQKTHRKVREVADDVLYTGVVDT
ncbi:MAG: hypothetical protein QOD39_2016, partial [Mycobacterium sp.]|nr:hypothetical protein [Mycobacterium sp.]